MFDDIIKKDEKLEETKKHVYLMRMRRSYHGTEGLLFTEGFNCATMELPWYDNIKTFSCIPPGDYICVKRFSPGRQYFTYWLKNVINRSWILCHSGNWAGDTRKGLKSDVWGCILLGKKHAIWKNQRMVINSRITVNAFQDFMEWEPFTLHIMETFKGK